MRQFNKGDDRWLNRFVEIAGYLQTQDRDRLLYAIKAKLKRDEDATLERLVLSAGHTGFTSKYPRLARAWRRQVDMVWWQYIRAGLRRANTTRRPIQSGQARFESLLLRLSLRRLLFLRLTF